MKMVGQITVGGQKFRAWNANEFSNLVTLILPAGTEVFKDNLWPLFLAQNGIDGGQHGTPRVVPLTKGARRLLVGVSEILAEKIRILGGKGALGLFTVIAHVSK